VDSGGPEDQRREQLDLCAGRRSSARSLSTAVSRKRDATSPAIDNQSVVTDAASFAEEDDGKNLEIEVFGMLISPR
jgi:hypothetical protein